MFGERHAARLLTAELSLEHADFRTASGVERELNIRAEGFRHAGDIVRETPCNHAAFDSLGLKIPHIGVVVARVDLGPDAPGKASVLFREGDFNDAEEELLACFKRRKVLVELSRTVAVDVVELPEAVGKLHLNVAAEFVFSRFKLLFIVFGHGILRKSVLLKVSRNYTCLAKRILEGIFLILVPASPPMALFLHHIALCAPLFILVALGWALIRAKVFTPAVTKALGSFTFRLLMPVMLFELLSNLSEMPPIDWRILIAFFGSCAIVYLAGRSAVKRLFHSDAAGTTVLAMAGIFGNNVQLGVPIVQVSLGDAAMPSISIIILFNVLLLWTVAIASVEFGRSGRITNPKEVLAPMLRVFRNPVVLGIIVGTAWGLTGWHLPGFVMESVHYVSVATTPMCLIVVGMGLAEHSFSSALPKGVFVTIVKLMIQPCLVWLIARLLGLGDLETNAVTLMAALPVAINAYLMAQDFEAEEGGASNAIFVSTFASAITVPLTLTLLGVAPVL